MQSPSVVLLAVLCTAATGQHRGGMTPVGRAPSGVHGAAPPLMCPLVNPYLTSDLTFAQRLGATVSGSSNGLPGFWGPVGPGPGSFRGWNGMPGFGGPGLSPTPLPDWNSVPAFAGSGFTPVPYPVFVGGSSDYYPPQPSNVRIMPPLQYAAGSAPMPTNEPVSGTGTFQISSAPVAVQETMDQELEREGQDNSSPDMSGVHVYQAPGPKPVPPRAYPALVALKNGAAFTVTTYRVKGNRLRFITTQGNYIEIPLAALDRLYPRQELDQTADVNVSPRRR